MEQNKDKCCPEFNVSKWDGITHTWDNKMFLRDNVLQFMHMPLNMGQVITRMWKKVQENDASLENIEDFLILTYDPSPWKSILHMTVAKEIPNEDMVKLSGTFISKVFDGPYEIMPQVVKDMEEYIKNKGLEVKKLYFHYAYCPKCAKEYGHNYIVAFAEV